MPWIPTNVLVPLDFSEFSFKALAHAEQLVDDLSGVHVIHVLPDLSPMEPGVIWGTVDDESRKANVIDSIRERFTEEQRTAISVAVRFGGTANEIADYAQEIGADLIVIPSHGRTGAAHVLIGSKAERVVRLAHCPVLVLRD